MLHQAHAGEEVGRCESVALRYPRSEDEAEYLALRRASERLLSAWEPTPEAGVGFDHPSAFTKILDRVRSERSRGLLICEATGGAIVGGVNLNEIVLGVLCSAYLGYWVGEGFGGRGYATEGVGLAVRYGFASLGLHRLEANIQPGNGASIAVARKCGFLKEGFSPRYLYIAGQWSDHERWAITREDVAQA